MGARLKREGRGGGRGQLWGCDGGQKFLESLSTHFSPKERRPSAEDEATYLSAPPSRSSALRAQSTPPASRSAAPLPLSDSRGAGRLPPREIRCRGPSPAVLCTLARGRDFHCDSVPS